VSDALDPTVGELLSALLDGQVTDEERATAQEWLDRSEAARDEYAELARVKNALRGLPAVDPPTGFYDTMLRRGSPLATVVPGSARDRARRAWYRQPATVAASAIATAAAWLLVGGVGSQEGTLVPPLDGVAASITSVPGAARTEVTILHEDDGEVAALRQDGAVGWDRLPEGRRIGDDVWIDLTTPPGLARVIVVHDGAVWTLASTELDAEGLLAVAEDLPRGDEDTLVGRLRSACDALLGG
jgi:hypothetical protein